MLILRLDPVLIKYRDSARQISTLSLFCVLTCLCRVVYKMAYITAIFILYSTVGGSTNQGTFQSVLFKFIDQTNQIYRLQHTRDDFRGRFILLTNIAKDPVFIAQLDANMDVFREFSHKVDDIKQRHGVLNQFVFHDNPNDTPSESKKTEFIHRALSITQDLIKIEILKERILAEIPRLELIYHVPQAGAAHMANVDLH